MIKKLLCVIFLVLLAGEVQGATYYAGPTGSGTDCTSGSPCTYTYALATKAGAGDTVIGKAGYAVEAGFVQPKAVANITLQCETTRACTIANGAAAGSRVLHQSAGATGLIIDGMVLDASGDETSCITQDSGSAVPALTLTNNSLINYKTNALLSAKMQALTASGNILSSSYAGNTQGYAIITVASGTVSITGDTITANNMGTTARGVDISVNTGVATALVVSNNAITLSAAAGTTAVTAILGSGATTYDVSGNAITITGTTSGAASAVIINAGTIAATRAYIHHNTGNLNGTVGYYVRIGPDDDAGAYANSISDIRLYNNNISNANHGFFVGWQTGAQIYNNIGTGAAIGASFKHCTNSLAYNNLFVGTLTRPMTGGALRDKASAGTAFYNNTHIAGGPSENCIYATQSDDTTVQSTAMTYKNNLCYGSATSTNLIYTNFANTSTITAVNNNQYYSAGTTTATPFNYRGTGYNFSDWKGTAGYDLAGASLNPGLNASYVPTNAQYGDKPTTDKDRNDTSWKLDASTGLWTIGAIQQPGVMNRKR